MKKMTFLLVALCLIGSTAAEAKKRRRVSSDMDMNGGGDFWLGLSTDGITQTAPGSISALLELSDKTALQLYFGIGGITAFNFGAGGAFKYTFSGDSAKGLHLGGGLGLGTVSTGATAAFFVRFGALLGLHFELIKNVLFSFDGGAFLRIGTGGAATTFTLGPNAATTLGMSILIRL